MSDMPYHSIESEIARHKAATKKSRDLSETVTDLCNRTLELDIKKIQAEMADREKELSHGAR